MESIVARAFKSSSFFSEVATKPVNSQPIGDGEDYLIISPAAGDDFSVDEFFDLKGLSEEEEKSSSSSSSCVSLQDQIDEGSSFTCSFTGTGASLSATDGLIIPVDDMKELELWSHLMDDTHCDDVFACPTRNVYVKTGPNIEKRVRFEPETKPATVEASCFPQPITGKPRTKRLRTTGATCAWPTCSLLKPGSDEVVKSKKPRVKKPKTKPAGFDDGGSINGPVQQRKCTHCQVQKTPQWRTGPFGPKTLCNACGVRFKSGRLFPEYRPACSPTFTSEVHSNSHRKVIEMRKKKMTEPAEPDLAPTVLSC